jgi:hypothetical protein
VYYVPHVTSKNTVSAVAYHVFRGREGGYVLKIQLIIVTIVQS